MYSDYSATQSFQQSLAALINTRPDWVGECIINNLTVIEKKKTLLQLLTGKLFCT